MHFLKHSKAFKKETQIVIRFKKSKLDKYHRAFINIYMKFNWGAGAGYISGRALAS